MRNDDSGTTPIPNLQPVDKNNNLDESTETSGIHSKEIFHNNNESTHTQPLVDMN